MNIKVKKKKNDNNKMTYLPYLKISKKKKKKISLTYLLCFIFSSNSKHTCTYYFFGLRGLRKNVRRLTDRLNMAFTVLTWP